MVHNRQWVVKSYPQGTPKVSDFEIKETETPELKEGEILIKNEYVSVDPYMRSRISGSSVGYAQGHKVGDRVEGATLGSVVESKSDQFKVGDSVVTWNGWQEYNISPAAAARKIELDIPKTAALNTLGMIGLTAYFGLLDIADPKEGETVLVSTAAGAVGIVVGQLAKIRGCRVVGTTSSDEKAQVLKSLGFDEVVNYKSPNLREEIKKACPKGIDVYFDNVGGELLEIAIEQINKHGRIPLCGHITQYNKLDTPDRGPNLITLIGKEVKIQGFLVGSYMKRAGEAFPKLYQWIKEGKLQSKETVFEGFEKVPEAFISLFGSQTLGKVIVKV